MLAPAGTFLNIQGNLGSPLRVELEYFQASEAVEETVKKAASDSNRQERRYISVCYICYTFYSLRKQQQLDAMRFAFISGGRSGYNLNN